MGSKCPRRCNMLLTSVPPRHLKRPEPGKEVIPIDYDINHNILTVFHPSYAPISSKLLNRNKKTSMPADLTPHPMRQHLL